MIKVCFPPGCYGTYFARCIYNFTDLRIGPFKEFEFADNGNSHIHRNEDNAQSVIQHGHIDLMTFSNDDRIVVVLPCQDHALDYFNNQFVKQQREQLVSYIVKQLPQKDIEYKLKTYWNYHAEFDNTVPRWIMREWCSFWIADVLNTAYNPTKYSALNSVAKLTTQDIFENFIDTLIKIVSQLNLTMTVDIDTIRIQHSRFLQSQKLHNSQRRCLQYVNDIIAGNQTTMSLSSIFDEAYIQHLLRQHNIEIRCDGLNMFPTTTQDLKILTYDNSNNCNSR